MKSTTAKPQSKGPVWSREENRNGCKAVIMPGPGLGDQDGSQAGVRGREGCVVIWCRKSSVTGEPMVPAPCRVKYTPRRLIASVGIFIAMVLWLCGCTESAGRRTDVGVFRYKKFLDSDSVIQFERPDGVVVRVDYGNRRAKHKTVLHPEGHPLEGRVQPLANGRTLQRLTELFPTLVALAKGRQHMVSDEILEVLQDFPSDRYRLAREDREGTFHLETNNALFIEGYHPAPYARAPVVIYWGADFTGRLDGDLLYCGYWTFDQYRQDLPLEVSPDALHSVRSGDVVRFAGREFCVEQIEWDRDDDLWNNSMTIRIEGADSSQVEKTWIGGSRPVTPEQMVQAVCWPNAISMLTGDGWKPASCEEFKRQLSLMGQASSERARGDVVRDILKCAGYDEILSASNGYDGSEDIWVVKEGESELTAIIAAHYDKAGQESQGIHDNGCGVVITAALARALQQMRTRLTYVFLFYGAHEVDGHNWTVWFTRDNLKRPVKYAMEVEGGGLVDAIPTFRVDHYRYTGWLNWQFPTLRINETGGPSHYLKHTAIDSLDRCDFSRLVRSYDQVAQIVLTIEDCLPH